MADNSTQAEAIFIFGAGGHAKVVMSVVEEQSVYKIAMVVDDDPALEGRDCYGYRIVGGRRHLLDGLQASGITKGLVAIGDNRNRLKVLEWLQLKGFEITTAVHPSAQIARGVRMGTGTVIMAGTVVNSDASLGEAVIVNTGATLDHDCNVADGVHIAPGCHLCGEVKVGRTTLVGAGSTVVPGIIIGCNVVIGAGSVVIQHVPDNTTAAGNPCRNIGSG